MNCKQARRLMHQLLDGNQIRGEPLERHLVQCPSCRAEFRALEQTQKAVERTVNCEPPADSLARATNAVLYGLDQPAEAHGARAWAPIAVAAGMLGALALGLLGGHAVWPREVVRVVEKVVEVPVIEERVVVERVPVVTPRVVYRDRPEHAEYSLRPAPPVSQRDRRSVQSWSPGPPPVGEARQPSADQAVAEAPPSADELKGGDEIAAVGKPARYWLSRTAAPQRPERQPVVPDQYVIGLESTPVFLGYSVSQYSRPAATVEKPAPPEVLPDAEQDQGAQDRTGDEVADQIAALPATGAAAD